MPKHHYDLAVDGPVIDPYALLMPGGDEIAVEDTPRHSIWIHNLGTGSARVGPTSTVSSTSGDVITALQDNGMEDITDLWLTDVPHGNRLGIVADGEGEATNVYVILVPGDPE